METIIQLYRESVLARPNWPQLKHCQNVAEAIGRPQSYILAAITIFQNKCKV